MPTIPLSLFSRDWAAEWKSNGMAGFGRGECRGIYNNNHFSRTFILVFAMGVSICFCVVIKRGETRRTESVLAEASDVRMVFRVKTALRPVILMFTVCNDS